MVPRKMVPERCHGRGPPPLGSGGSFLAGFGAWLPAALRMSSTSARSRARPDASFEAMRSSACAYEDVDVLGKTRLRMIAHREAADHEVFNEGVKKSPSPVIPSPSPSS